jgi:hypothetical protein
MSKLTREGKLFKNENKILETYGELVAQENSPDKIKSGLVHLTGKYKNLLEQARFLTWISGRLERKLQRKNKELIINNARLQQTLDELTKAEAGKNAYAIIYSIAIVLFVLEEFFVEPVIRLFDDTVVFGIIIKLFIVLALKASEGFVEKWMMKPRKPPEVTRTTKHTVV